MVRILGIAMLAASLLLSGCQSAEQLDDRMAGWIPLFDGKSLMNWTASENKNSFSVEDGMIKAAGDRSHLFYTGPVEDHVFTNFEWKCDILTKPQANSGMYFHTEYQETGWPDKGYEVQVNNSHSDWRRTGGLYAVVDVRESPAQDDEWFTQHVIVSGRHITVKVNGEVTAMYTEPYEVAEKGHPNMPGRKLGSGTVAFQAHDPGSVAYYKNIMIRPLD